MLTCVIYNKKGLAGADVRAEWPAAVWDAVEDALVTTEVVEVLAAPLLSKIRIASVRSEANSFLWFAMRKHGTQGTQGALN